MFRGAPFSSLPRDERRAPQNTPVLESICLPVLPKILFNFRFFFFYFLSDTLDLYLDGTLPYSGKVAVTVNISPKFSLYSLFLKKCQSDSLRKHLTWLFFSNFGSKNYGLSVGNASSETVSWWCFHDASAFSAVLRNYIEL